MVVGGWDELLERPSRGGGKKGGRERMGKELGNGKGWQAREGGTSTRARLLQRWSLVSLGMRSRSQVGMGKKWNWEKFSCIESMGRGLLKCGEEEEERIWECSFIIILPKLANWSYRRRQRLKF